MKQIKIELIDYMGSDLSTVNSARVSFDKESNYEFDSETNTSVLSSNDVGLISYLAKHNHSTPFRHNQVQIRCHAPIFLAAQLKKHQAGLSWNEVSRRYVSTEPEFFIPDEWRGVPDGSIKQGSSGTVDTIDVPYYEGSTPISTWYNKECINSLESYKMLLESGVAPEMARMVLPQSMMTSWYWSGNILAFAHVYKERIAPGAQLEAQHFASELDKVIQPLFPESWKALTQS